MCEGKVGEWRLGGVGVRGGKVRKGGGSKVGEVRLGEVGVRGWK